MDYQLAVDAKAQLDRFCSQYLQLEPQVDYPDERHLGDPAVQQYIYARLYKENAITYGPPRRYQLRILKELIRRIERSIVDWEAEVWQICSS